MGSLFSKPKSKTPPEPVFEPPLITEDTGAEDAERRKLRRKSGRKQTFLTGDLVPETTKKAVFG